MRRDDDNRPMSTFRKALLWTAIPIGAIASFSSIAGGREGTIESSWGIAAALWLVALVLAAVFAVTGKRQVASGMLAGIGISFLVLGITCFANMWA